MSEVDKLVENNASYAAGFEEAGAGKVPDRKVAVVACMDARLDVYRLLGLELGQAHVIRNAGGVVTEDTIRSLLISQRYLDTREVMLVHHSDCGMIGLGEDQERIEIERDTGIRPPFALEGFADLDEDVRQSIRRLEASPFLPDKDGIRGFVYDVATGGLREVS